MYEPTRTAVPFAWSSENIFNPIARVVGNVVNAATAQLARAVKVRLAVVSGCISIIALATPFMAAYLM